MKVNSEISTSMKAICLCFQVSFILIYADLVLRFVRLLIKAESVPHNPVRFADTVGVVVEQLRPKDSVDRLRWYCQNCKEIVHEDGFHCTDLGSQIKDAVLAFTEDMNLRTCKKCGTLCNVK